MAVRERIRINGTPISEEDFAKFFYDVWDRLGQNEQVRQIWNIRPATDPYFLVIESTSKYKSTTGVLPVRDFGRVSCFPFTQGKLLTLHISWATVDSSP